MNYFQIKQDPRSLNPILPQVPDSVDIWKSDKPAFFQVKDLEGATELDFLPFIEKPIYVISDPMKNVLDMYQSKMLFKPCAIGSIKQRRIEIYWLMQPRIIDCLDASSVFHPDGTMKEMVLNRDKIGFNKVFQVDYVRGRYLIVDTEVLERLLREGVHALQWIPVEIS